MSDNNIWVSHPSICHYTSIERTKKILQSKCLWATHFSHLNDESEIHYAKKFIMEKLTKLFLKYSPDQIKAGVDHLFGATEQYIFTASFCTLKINPYLKDDDGILSMWRYYGDNGCFIEFDTKKFWEYLALEKLLYFHFGKAYYGEQQEEMKYLLSLIRDEFRFAIETGQTGSLDTFKNFFTYIAMLKHPGFHEECEIRLAMMNGFGVEIQPATLLIKTSPEKRSYIELPFKAKCIKKIVIGPDKNQDAMLKEIKQWCKKRPEYNHVQFGKSEIPYRKK